MIHTRKVEGFGTWRLDNNAPDKKWRLTFTVEGNEYRHQVRTYDSAEIAAATIGDGRSLHLMWDKDPAAKLPPVPLSKWVQEG